MSKKFYITTPIYYVNDKPHIGHVYTTTIADILACYHRELLKEDVFFLTGTDEHAGKVVESAQQHGVTPMDWANRNAAAFAETFSKLGITNSDFIRTTQERHKKKVQQYILDLQNTDDIYLGEYEGWYDTGQEEYVPDTKAKDYNYISPINKKPLVRKKEKNYFFRLSRYQKDLLDLLEGSEVKGQSFKVLPQERCNEVLGRINEGLNDVPISRAAAEDWGIPIPGDSRHTVYVWIDALFNYLSVVDMEDRLKYWPADVHLIAKDILWFHAVIWPALLLALKRDLPKVVYAHSFWISEGQKMSKSLGNFIDLEKIHHYVTAYGLDAFRWFLAKEGPFEVMDSDFVESRFIDVYNRDLANDYGNLLNRVSGLIGKSFDGRVPDGEADPVIKELADDLISENGNISVRKSINQLKIDEAIENIMSLIRYVNRYLEYQAPWKKERILPDATRLGSPEDVLYTATEALRLCTVLLRPVMPQKTNRVLDILGAAGTKAQWGQLKPGTKLKSHEALFPRIETK